MNIDSFNPGSKDLYYDKWEKSLDEPEKIKMLARLDMLEDLQNYITLLREGYTRTLKINNVEDDGTIKEVEVEKFRFEVIKEEEKDNNTERSGRFSA